MFSISFETITKAQKIGEGGFGVVYKGTYQFAPAAIKQLHIDKLSPEAEEEFNKEATIMAQLHHPNVVHFYGYCTIPKCLVMEYMPKGSLFSVLHDKRESLDWGVRMRIAMDMASGLAFLHSKNILHRDIKSLNVLLDDQRAKLCDFGLSKVKNETSSKRTANKTKQNVGTTQWMAPELFNFEVEPIYTSKSDIYSLGITFWELAAYKIPYASRNSATIPYIVTQGKREEIPSGCPEKLAYLIQQCWEGSPEARPSAADIARFMTMDAKTLKEVEASPKSPAPQSVSEYQLFTPAYGNNPNPSLSALSLQANPVSPVAAPNATTQRRGSNIINLTDKKEEKEKIQHVLEELRTFFIEERYIGEKTENYALYNEYLKKANSGVQLAYKPTQKKHLLYVNGKPLEDADTAAQEISKMIDALTVANILQKPKVPPTPQQQNPAPAMLTQLNQTLKPSPTVNLDPKVNADELKAFLRLVAEGEQDKAEAMLKSNPALALVPGDVTDLSKRTFNNITGFQYAVWALDWHMWTMIRKHLPDEAAREQAQGFETGSWVRQHGVHANLNTLIQAYQTTDDLYKAKKYTEANTAWVQQIGGAQLLLPAHVINEYCHPTRPFYPLPNFKDAGALPRLRTLDEGEWFTASYNGGKLGEKFACYRGGCRRVGGDASLGGVTFDCRECDHEGVRVLTSTRTAQRSELVTELRPKTAQRKAA